MFNAAYTLEAYYDRQEKYLEKLNIAVDEYIHSVTTEKLMEDISIELVEELENNNLLPEEEMNAAEYIYSLHESLSDKVWDEITVVIETYHKAYFND